MNLLFSSGNFLASNSTCLKPKSMFFKTKVIICHDFTITHFPDVLGKTLGTALSLYIPLVSNSYESFLWNICHMYPFYFFILNGTILCPCQVGLRYALDTRHISDTVPKTVLKHCLHHAIPISQTVKYSQVSVNSLPKYLSPNAFQPTLLISNPPTWSLHSR